MSAEEFLNLPDEPGKQELLDRELIAVPPAKLIGLTVDLGALTQAPE